MAAMLDFQNSDYILLTFCNISASKLLRLLMLVSKHTRNLMGQLIMRYIYIYIMHDTILEILEKIHKF